MRGRVQGRVRCYGALLVFVVVVGLAGCGSESADIQAPAVEGPVSAVVANTPAPLSCWDFDEGVGTSVGDQCDGHDGSIMGASWADGVCGAALEFDGVNDYVAMPGGDWLTQPQGAVCAWIRVHPDVSQARIISTETAGWHNGLYLGWVYQLSNDTYINGGISAGIHSTEGGPHYAEVYVDNVAKGEWHFVALVWDGDANSLLLYVDGQTATLTSPHPGIVDTGERLTIGTWEVGTSHGAWFKGGVDEVKFYNQTLTVDDLNELYASSCSSLSVSLDIKPGSCPNPINPKSRGVLPVAILGTADLDVHDIDVSSLLLDGVAPLRSSIDDVSAPVVAADACDCTEDGPDGHADLTLKFKTQDMVAALAPLTPGEARTLTITGTLLDGTPFEGTDCVVVVGRKPAGGNEWIVFARDTDVWRARPDGSVVERVVDVPAGARARTVIVSPDASQLVYTEFHSDYSMSNRLVIANIDGSNARTLVETGGNGLSEVCDFHPDGTRVMYLRDVSPGGAQNYELFEVALDGSSDVNLTNHPNNEGCGSYSPTGDRITFASGSPGCSLCGDVYTQNRDGTGRTAIFNLGGDSDNTPKWSPDGARIAVSSRYPGDQEDLYLVDPDGSNPVQLTHTFRIRERNKAWSPDGSRIVFERDGSLYFIDRDGSNDVLFIENGVWPDWGGMPTKASSTYSGRTRVSNE